VIIETVAYLHVKIRRIQQENDDLRQAIRVFASLAERLHLELITLRLEATHGQPDAGVDGNALERPTPHGAVEDSHAAESLTGTLTGISDAPTGVPLPRV